MENIKKTNDTNMQKVDEIKKGINGVLTKIKDSITPENIVGLLSVIGGVVVLVLHDAMEHGYTFTASKGDVTVAFAPGGNQKIPVEVVVDAPEAYDEECITA